MKTKIEISCESDFGHMSRCAFRHKDGLCLKTALPNLDSSYEQVCRSARSNRREETRRSQVERRIGNLGFEAKEEG